MRKLISWCPFPLGLTTVLLSIWGALYFSMNSCRKIDYNREKYNEKNLADRFLDVPSDAPSPVKRIAAKIKKQNDEHSFLNKIAKEAGIPWWGKSLVIVPQPGRAVSAGSGTETINGGGGGGIFGTDTLAFIPLGKIDEPWVSSFMVCLVGDSNKVAIRLARGDLYSAYGMTKAMDTISSELVALHCMYLEYLASDYRDSLYRVNDLRLFRWDSMHLANASRFVKFIGVEEPESAGGNQVNVLLQGLPCFAVSYMEWQNIMEYAPPDETPHQQYNANYYCIDYNLWLDYVLNGPGQGGSMDGGEYGGGGGDDWYNEIVCRVLPGQDPCGGYSGTGWTVVVEPVDEDEYNPYLYDTVSVSEEILDSNFNCLYDILKNDLADINGKVQLTLFNVFGVSLYNHVHFKMNWAADSTSDYIFRTAPAHREWVGDSLMYFYDTIEINPYFAIHATQEMLISAAIHESIHAYINWCFISYQQQANDIDSNYLIDHFPIHWQYFMNRPYNWQHDLMVNNYVNEITNAVLAGGNQNAPQGIRNFVGAALAYAGLKKTSVWQTLADTCNYKGVAVWCQDYDKPSNWQYTPPGCGNYPISFRDSLQLLGPCQ